MIRLTAYNQETEPNRIVRLQALRALIEYSDRKTFDHIEELHDHKGQLTVVYLRGYGKNINRGLIESIWDDTFGEREIQHMEAMFHCTSLGWNESLWSW